MRSRVSKIAAALSPEEAREWGLRSTTEYGERFNLKDEESVLDLQYLLRVRGKQ